MPTGQEPAEGGRKVIERELARQGPTKKPDRKAEDGKPGPANNPKLEHPQRGN